MGLIRLWADCYIYDTEIAAYETEIAIAAYETEIVAYRRMRLLHITPRFVLPMTAPAICS